MEIVLLRHGKPQIQRRRRLSAAELPTWVDAYNAAGLDCEHPPPGSTRNLLAQRPFVVCSDLPRSRESAEALGVTSVDACESTFREINMPSADWPFPRLSLTAWEGLFWFLWLLGYSTNTESVADARKRAQHCSERLAAWAAEHGTVLFVGHGSLNWFISRHLRRCGWSGPWRSPQRYWEFAIYRLGPVQ